MDSSYIHLELDLESLWSTSTDNADIVRLYTFTRDDTIVSINLR